jgi:hypothetical protein
MANPYIEQLNEYVQEDVRKHGQDLQDMMKREITGDSNGNSYLTKKEMMDMLNNHFKEVNKLIEETMKEQPQLDKKISLTEKLENSVDGMKQQINNSIDGVKQGVVDWKNEQLQKVEDVKEHIKETINKKIEAVNERVKAMTAKLEQSLTMKTIPMKEKEPSKDINKESGQTQTVDSLKQQIADLTAKLEKEQANVQLLTGQKQAYERGFTAQKEFIQSDKDIYEKFDKFNVERKSMGRPSNSPAEQKEPVKTDLSRIEKENKELGEVNKKLIYNNNRYSKQIEIVGKFMENNSQIKEMYNAFVDKEVEKSPDKPRKQAAISKDKAIKKAPLLTEDQSLMNSLPPEPDMQPLPKQMPKQTKTLELSR